MAALTTIPVEGTVSCVSFSPHFLSSSLLAVGTESKIVIKSVSLTDDVQSGQSLSDEVLSVEDIFSVLYGTAAHITWSPASSTQDAQFRFYASVRQNGSITAFSSTPDSTTTEELPGHKSMITDLCTHPTDETLLASVGEDCVCRLWDLQQSQLRSEFKLTSPGVSVRWHEQDPVKKITSERGQPLQRTKPQLMVAERNGRIRIYDISTDCALQSLDCPTPPLITADWSPSNQLLVGGVAGCSWFLWDLSQSSQPLDSKVVHKSPISRFRWCVQSDSVFATLSASSQLKIHHLAHQRVPVSCDLLSSRDLSWHAQIPLVGVASDRAVKCWIVET